MKTRSRHGRDSGKEKKENQESWEQTDINEEHQTQQLAGSPLIIALLRSSEDGGPNSFVV